MLILEENVKHHLEAFAQVYIYIYIYIYNIKKDAYFYVQNQIIGFYIVNMTEANWWNYQINILNDF